MPDTSRFAARVLALANSCRTACHAREARVPTKHAHQLGVTTVLGGSGWIQALPVICACLVRLPCIRLLSTVSLVNLVITMMFICGYCRYRLPVQALLHGRDVQQSSTQFEE